MTSSFASLLLSHKNTKTKIEMMTMKRQNKLGSYLAVTAGVGCAASVAEGAIQVVDLSGVSTSGELILPAETGDELSDINIFSDTNAGFLFVTRDSLFYSDLDGVGNASSIGRGYTVGPASFPLDRDDFAQWYSAAGSGNGGFQVGLNYVAFKDSADNFGWLSFTLDSLTANSTSPISSFGHFVYDDTSTSPANAIPLETAIAAVPEPSSLALLALGSVGLAARRQRKKAA